MKIVLHYLASSRAHRIAWLLEELGLDYAVRSYARDERTGVAPAELRQAHPLGKAPVLEFSGQVLAESGAIVEYLLSRHARSGLRPVAGSAAEWEYLYWLHYAEGSIMPALLMCLVTQNMRRGREVGPAMEVVKDLADRMDQKSIHPHAMTHLDFMEESLRQRPFFAGDALTGADIMMSFPIRWASDLGVLGPDHVRLREFTERVSTRPAHRRATLKVRA